MMLKRMSGKYVVNHQDDDDDDNIVDHKDDHDGQGVDQQDEHHDDIVDLKDDHDGYVVDHKMNMMMRNDVHLLLEREAAIEPHHLNLGSNLKDVLNQYSFDLNLNSQMKIKTYRRPKPLGGLEGEDYDA